MKVIKGDLLELADKGRFNIIIHGCNCQTTMGSGIALQIKNKWPEVYQKDLNTKHWKFDKLGNFSSCDVVNSKGGNLIVINAYTQRGFGKGRQINYGAISSCFQRIEGWTTHDDRIGIPLIGADRGGGDWEIISEIIDFYMKDRDLTLVEYEKG